MLSFQHILVFVGLLIAISAESDPQYVYAGYGGNQYGFYYPGFAQIQYRPSTVLQTRRQGQPSHSFHHHLHHHHKPHHHKFHEKHPDYEDHLGAQGGV